MPKPRFLVGYNEAWFGDRFGSDLTTHYDRARVVATLDGIARAGGHVVRLWVFEGREGMVLDAKAPRIRSLDPALLRNLGEVLVLARQRALWVYATALEGNEMPLEPSPIRDHFVALLNDEGGEGDAFHENALAPLLTLLGEHRDVVYALDLMNEIEAPRDRGYWRDPHGGPRAFMKRTRAFVKTRAPWLRVTTSAGWDSAARDISSGFFSGLGLDFYDLHVYADDGQYPAREVCDRAAADGVRMVLGEFGQKSRVVDDGLQASATERFLVGARSACFEAALAWRFDAAEKWWSFARSDGSFRPAAQVMVRFAGH